MEKAIKFADKQLIIKRIVGINNRLWDIHLHIILISPVDSDKKNRGWNNEIICPRQTNKHLFCSYTTSTLQISLDKGLFSSFTTFIAWHRSNSWSHMAKFHHDCNMQVPPTSRNIVRYWYWTRELCSKHCLQILILSYLCVEP